MPARVTLRDIAARAGVHPSTVSLALRGHRSIPEATQRQLVKLAEEMGYSKDPVLSALVAHRFQRGETSFRGVLAWIDAWPKEGWAREDYCEHWRGAREKADALGWKLEEFWLGQPGMSGRRAAEILRSRGVLGVFVPPMPSPTAALDFDFSRFSAVAVTFSLQTPRLHRVVPNAYDNIRMALGRLRALGYVRPGLMLHRAIDLRTNNYLTAAMLEDHWHNYGETGLPPFIYQTRESAPFRSWVSKHHPDVIVTYDGPWVMDELEQMGFNVPEQIGVLMGTKPKPNDGRFACIDERMEEVGARGVDVLVKLIQMNENGVPHQHFDTFVEGAWLDGRSVRPRARPLVEILKVAAEPRDASVAPPRSSR